MLVCALWFGSFALDTVRLHKAGGGAEEPIYNQAFSQKLEPRHGLPPPRPQIAARSAAQINSEQRDKIQATALWAVKWASRINFFPTQTRSHPALRSSA